MNIWHFLTRRLPGSLTVQDGKGWAVGVTPSANLPICEAAREGEERRHLGSGTTSSKHVRCLWDGTAFAWTEIPAGTLPARGTADIDLLPGLSGAFTIDVRDRDLTPGSAVLISQVPGDVPDELAWAMFTAAGVVRDEHTITGYWTAPSPMVGAARVAWQVVS